MTRSQKKCLRRLVRHWVGYSFHWCPLVSAWCVTWTM